MPDADKRRVDVPGVVGAVASQALKYADKTPQQRARVQLLSQPRRYIYHMVLHYIEQAVGLLRPDLRFWRGEAGLSAGCTVAQLVA